MDVNRRKDKKNRLWAATTAARPAVAVVGALALTLAGCGGGGGGSAASSSTTSAPPTSTPPSSTTTTLPSVSVADATGARFLVQTGPVMGAPYIELGSFLWSAAPGQQFFRDTLRVTNPSHDTEDLSAFDDLTSGIASDVEFVMPASDASSSGFSGACGVAASYPSSLCPISFGQGVMVDSDSADQNDHSVVQLAPGSSAQVIVSYGPILASVPPSSVAVYFDSGQSAPVDLTP